MAFQRNMRVGRIKTIYSDCHVKWSEFVEKIKNYETPERWKGTFVERWGKYWRNVYMDYQEVVLDITKQCKTRPVRMSTYAGVLGGIYYLAKNNPDDISYREELLINTMRMIPVGESVRNPTAVNHIRLLEECYNENLIRRLNLGILSLMWIDNSDSRCSNYQVSCSYLKPRYVTFHERIIDVGFLNTWWIWREKMKDYDVNDEEFKNSQSFT